MIMMAKWFDRHIMSLPAGVFSGLGRLYITHMLSLVRAAIYRCACQ
jgi:hypothetical protein